MNIYSITTQEERDCLAELAKEVPDNCAIVEIGTLYGGTTVVLAQAQPHAAVITIDDYSWHPDPEPLTSPSLVRDNLDKFNIDNVTIVSGDSREVGKMWAREISLLWIDGGHSFDFVHNDLLNFGKHAQVIALHDYKNPAWPTIEQAIISFVEKYPFFYIDKVVGMICVLRRK